MSKMSTAEKSPSPTNAAAAVATPVTTDSTVPAVPSSTLGRLSFTCQRCLSPLQIHPSFRSDGEFDFSFIYLQGDHGGLTLRLVDFDLLAPLFTQFCLGR